MLVWNMALQTQKFSHIMFSDYVTMKYLTFHAYNNLFIALSF